MLEILTPGEKVRKIRKMIGATQKEVAGDEITRNLISQIENGKTNLSIATTKIIADNMNSIITKKGIKNLYITTEWLLEDIDTQANNIADNYIKELSIIRLENREYVFFQEKVKEIETFIKRWNVCLKRQYKIYEIISEIYFMFNKYDESFFKIEISLDIAIQDKSYSECIRLMLELSRRLDSVGGTSLEHLRTMHLALNMYKENNLNDESTLKKIYFNTALHHSKLDRYDISIEYLDKLTRECSLSIRETLDVNLLKANCYEDINRLNEAEKLYLSTLDVALKEYEATVISKIYNSLGTLYRLKKDKINSLKYINYSLHIQNDIKEKDYAKTLYYATENYIEMDIKNLVLDTYHLALSWLDKTFNSKLYYSLSIKLYNYFIGKEEYNVLYNILKKIEVAIKRKIIVDKESVNLFFTAAYTVKPLNKKKSEELFETGINLLKLL